MRGLLKKFSIKSLLKKTSHKASFGAGLDYLKQGQSGRHFFNTASKFEGGLVNYRQPSSIDIANLRSESRKAFIDSPELIVFSRTLKVLLIADGLKLSSASERGLHYTDYTCNKIQKKNTKLYSKKCLSVSLI